MFVSLAFVVLILSGCAREFVNVQIGLNDLLAIPQHEINFKRYFLVFVRYLLEVVEFIFH